MIKVEAGKWMVYKCDRCGTIYESYNHDVRLVNVSMYNKYDLCPSCSTELVNWFNGKDENNNGESS